MLEWKFCMRYVNAGEGARWFSSLCSRIMDGLVWIYGEEEG
jgi:hypothetical protein